MKKAFSILLLINFLFNLGGYYFFFWAMKVQATHELSIKIDEGDYSDNETFEIKIPITLPYPLQTNEFERQTGQFVYKQEYYQLVKQKYENDTLTIVCLKDAESKQLTKAMDSFSEASGHQPLQDGSLNIPAKIFQEYVSSLSASITGREGWSQKIGYTPYFNNVSRATLATFSPPPWA